MADNDPRLFPAPPTAGGSTSISSDSKDWILQEVAKGLRRHRPRLAAAIENQAFYDLNPTDTTPPRGGDGVRLRRPAETAVGLPPAGHRPALRAHVQPGPAADGHRRRAAETLLEARGRRQPDRLRDAARRSSGGGRRRAAVQVKATNDPDKPVDLQLWGAMSSPSLPTRRTAGRLCRRDHRRGRSEHGYKVWFRDEVYTYITDATVSITRGGSSCRVRKRGMTRRCSRRAVPRSTPMAASRSRSCTTEPRPPVLDGGAGHVPAQGGAADQRPAL